MYFYAIISKPGWEHFIFEQHLYSEELYYENLIIVPIFISYILDNLFLRHH